MSEGFDTDEIRSMIKAGGIFDDEVIKRAIELIKSGDMDIDFMCDDCERGNCDDCQREPQYDESRE